MYWLLDEIAIIQPYNKAVAAEEFQVWNLAVRPDRTATLTCDDGNGNVVFTKEIEHTDFPLDQITLYFANNVIHLPASTEQTIGPRWCPRLRGLFCLTSHRSSSPDSFVVPIAIVSPCAETSSPNSVGATGLSRFLGSCYDGFVARFPVISYWRFMGGSDRIRIIAGHLGQAVPNMQIVQSRINTGDCAYC